MKVVRSFGFLLIAAAVCLTGLPEAPTFIPSIDDASAQFAARTRRPQTEARDRPESQTSPVMSEQAFRQFENGRELMNATPPDFAGALEVFRTIAMSTRRSDHERSSAFQHMGYVYSSMEQYTNSINAMRQAIDIGGLTPAMLINTIYNLGQIFMVMEDWPNAVSQIELWFQISEEQENYIPRADPYMLLGQAYYNLNRIDDAIIMVESAIGLSPSPRKNWYQFLLALHLGREDYRTAEPLLEQMVILFPDERLFYQQLGAIYAELGKDPESLAMQEILYQRGMLERERDITQLAQMYAYFDLPYWAASVLDRGIREGIVTPDEDNLTDLGDNWIRAREYARSIPPLTDAAALSDDGELYMRLGRSYFEEQDWENAVESFDNAIGKGGLEACDEGTTWLLIGMAEFNQDDNAAALRALRRARGYRCVQRDADRWVEYLGALARLQ